MASTINASNSGFGGIVSTGDSSGQLQLQTANTTAVTIDTSQNVGIGTSSPSTKLQTSSSGNNWITIASTGTTGQEVGTIFNAPTSSGASNQWKIGTNSTIDNEFTLYDITSSQIVNRYIRGASGYSSFWTNGTERMRINSNGNVLVGTTTEAANETPLVLSKNSGTTRWAVGPFASVPTNFYITATSAAQGVFLNGSSATSWSALSDERTKDIIEPIENAVEKVSTLRAVIGKYKSDDENNRKAFLIAQDVQAVLPEAVSVANPETGHLGLAYTDVIPLLVAAIKEQQTIINDLKARIETLESK